MSLGIEQQENGNCVFAVALHFPWYYDTDSAAARRPIQRLSDKVQEQLVFN
jgi:hypothetical protein